MRMNAQGVDKCVRMRKSTYCFAPTDRLWYKREITDRHFSFHIPSLRFSNMDDLPFEIKHMICASVRLPFAD